MKIKIITAIYNNLFGTEYGGRINRGEHYKWSLLSLLKMNDADFVCYTSKNEFEILSDFFYNRQNIDPNKLELKIFELSENYFKDLINNYKNIEDTKKSDRCIEIQYMKFIWSLIEIENTQYDYYYWFDAGLSHCGLLPQKHLTLFKTDLSGMRRYYESGIFNNKFLNNLVKYTDDLFLLVAKENQRNYWSGTVDPKYYNNYSNGKHIIGGFFGGKRGLWEWYVGEFIKNINLVTENEQRLYAEENIMTLIYYNNIDKFKTLDFDIWWHENEIISGIDILEHTKNNKSFYKILEEVNNNEY